MTSPDTQTIDITTATGGIEYTWPLTISELSGRDISADTVRLSLGSVAHPGGTWLTPDLDPAQSVKSQRVVQLLIGSTLKPASGDYVLWSKVTDGPEVVVRRHQRITINADT